MHVMRVGPTKAGWWGGAACALLAAALVLSARTAAPPASHADAIPADVSLPLAFERNLGQSDRAVDFVSRGRGYTLFVTPHEAVLRLRDAAPPLRLRWLGAAAAPALTADRAQYRRDVSGAAEGGIDAHGGLQLRAAVLTLTRPAPTINQNTAAGKRS